MYVCIHPHTFGNDIDRNESLSEDVKEGKKIGSFLVM